MPALWIAVIVAALVALLGVVVWVRGRGGRRLARQRVAAEQFRSQAGELEQTFLIAANATGKPRGLKWTSFRFNTPPLFAIDRNSGTLCALVGGTVTFEAIAGGGMEEVEAVGNVRYATAVFAHRHGVWETEGRAVFNLEPAESLQRFGEALEPVTDI